MIRPYHVCCFVTGTLELLSFELSGVELTELSNWVVN